MSHKRLNAWLVALFVAIMGVGGGAMGFAIDSRVQRATNSAAIENNRELIRAIDTRLERMNDKLDRLLEQ